MNVVIALSIENRFRFATKDIILNDDFTDESKPVAYSPKILSADFLRSEISLEADGDASISNISISIADPDKELFSYFSNKRLESVSCIYKMVIDNVVAKEIYCTLGDYSFSKGVVNFDIRVPESVLDNDYMKMFTPVSFQWLEIPEVVNTTASGTWIKLPDPSWQIVGADYRRSYYYQTNPLAENDTSDTRFEIGMNYVGYDPRNAYESAFFGGWKKTVGAASSGEDYADFISAGNFDRIPIKNVYRQYYQIKNVILDDGTGVGNKFQQIVKDRGYTQTGSEYDTSGSEEPIFENFRSQIYDFINNKFLVNFTGEGPAGGTISYIAGDTLGNGDVISIKGTGSSSGKTLLDTSVKTQFEYKYAQVDSSFGDGNVNYDSATTTSPEVIAYLVSGFGAMWYDIDTDAYYWISSGTPPTGTEALASDYRLAFLSGIPTDLRKDPLSYINGDPEDSVFGNTFKFKTSHNRKTPIFPVNTGILSSDQITIADDDTAQFGNRRTMDRLLVAASGIIPDPDLDPDYSAGYLWLGQKGKLIEYTPFQINTQGRKFTKIVYGDELKLFCRYKIHAVHQDIISPVVTRGLSGPRTEFASPASIIEIQVHNRHLDSDNEFAVNIYPRQGAAELPDPSDMRTQRTFDEDGGVMQRSATSFAPFVTEQSLTEFPLELYQIDFYLGTIKVQLRGLSEEERYQIAADQDYRDSFRNRRKGQRIDQVLNFESLVNDISTSVQFTTDPDGDSSATVSVEEQNSNIINAATERFAVIKESYLTAETQGSEQIIYETIFFHIPYEGGYALAAGVEAATPDTAAADAAGAFGPQKGVKAYTNRMAYRPKFNSAEDLRRTDATSDAGSAEANLFFNNSVYRIMHDCVPQNASDLGKFFPIVYGRVFRVPMLHVISNPALEEASESAGDDVYIFASHQTGVSTPADIIIELDVREYKSERESIQKQLDDQRSGILDQLPVSPFPSYLDGHRTVKVISNPGQQVRNVLSRPFRLNNPYHKLIEKYALDGRKYYGIQLRGNEWDERAGQSDKRYPIRNGFGKSGLYATFSGYYDAYSEYTNSGGVIEHPIDVIRHFIKTYGRKPYADNIIDERSAQIVKAATPNYRASIYLTEKMPFNDFLTKICEQFGIYRGSCDGKIFFYSYDLESINWNKPIIDKLNVLEDCSEDSNGYSDYITDIVLKYRFDYPSKEYKETIYLNSKNDLNLSKAASLLQGRNTKEIQADWIQDHSTAFAVARSIAKVNSVKKRQFNLSIKIVEGIYPEIGDIVPVTIERLNLTDQPCIVVSHQIRQDGFVDLKLATIEELVEAKKYTMVDLDEEVVLPPENITAPVISGTVQIGRTLATTNGSWTNSPYSYTYQWYRDGSAISGETDSSYIVEGVDIYSEITCKVIAINDGGSSAAEESNSLSSAWYPILAVKPDLLIFDSKDSYCYGDVGIGAPVENVYAVTGQLIGTQSVTSRQAIRESSEMLQFDGIDDHYLLDSLATAIVAADGYTIQVGFEGVNALTARQTIWGLAHTLANASNLIHFTEYHAPASPFSARMRSYYSYGTALSVPLTSLTQPIDLSIAQTQNSTRVVDARTGTLIQASSVATPSQSPPCTYLTWGALRYGSTPTVAHYWGGKIRHWALSYSTWSDAEVEIYKNCAIAAGAI